MINEIQKALDEGFTSEQVIKYLLKKFPHFSSKIQKALTAGFSTDQVLKFLAGGRKSLNSDQPMTEHQKTRSKDIEQRENVNKRFAQGAGIAGAALATPYIAELATPMAEAALQRAIPSNLSNLGASAQSQLRTALQQGKSTVPQQPPAVNPANIPQQQNIPQAKTSITDLFNKYKGFKDKIDQLKSSGNDAESIIGYFKKFNASQTDKLEKEAGRPIEEVISEYLASKPVEQAAISPQPVEKPEEIAHVPELQGTEQPTKELIPETAKPTEEAKEPEEPAKPIAKKDSVITPQGAGEIRDIKEKNALVEIDGKLHKVPIEDIEQEPEDVIQTVQQLLKIPEVDRSSVVSLFTYDPEENKMYIQFHTGDTYKYLDVDPEKVMTVANKMGIPVTKGQNIFGAWSPEDKQSLGATLIKEIINDPKYKKAKKGETANPNYIKLETLYDYWEKLRKKPKRKRL